MKHADNLLDKHRRFAAVITVQRKATLKSIDALFEGVNRSCLTLDYLALPSVHLYTPCVDIMPRLNQFYELGLREGSYAASIHNIRIHAMIKDTTCPKPKPQIDK